MSMKLSYRDKVIFIVVICILVLVAGFMLFIKPRITQLDIEKLNLENTQKEEIRVNEKIGTLEPLLVTLKDTAKEIDEVQQNFYVEAQPYEFEQMVRGVLNSRNIEYTSFETSYASAGKITRYNVNPAHVLAYDVKMNGDIYKELPQEVYDRYTGKANETFPEAIIGVTNVSFAFEAAIGLDTMFSCLDDLAALEQTLYVNFADLNNVVEADQLKSENSITLTIYSIVPMNIEKVNAENGEIVPAE